MKDSSSPSRRFNPRAFLGFMLCLASAGLAILSLAAGPPGKAADSGANAARDSVAAPQVRQGIYRGIPVTYVVKDGKAIFQGDIILEKVDPIDPQHGPRSVGIDSLSIAYSQYLWPQVGNQYQIPYVIAPGSGNLTNLNTAIAQFNSTFPNIQFVARTTQVDYVNFYFDPNNNNAQCEATVGRVGGQQQVGGAGGSFNPCAVGTLLHEMGHAIGLWHEQARPDRNTYLSVNYGNVIKGSYSSNFQQLYDNAQQTTLFDYASIMEYPAFAFSRNGAPVIETIPAGIPLSNPNGYSAADIDSISRLYGSPPTAVTVTSNPPGLQVIVDGVTVTTPQVYSNWAFNSIHTLDIPAGVQSQPGFIGTSGQPTTFYYTYGRWNDSTAAAHSITILPGNGYPHYSRDISCDHHLLGELHPAGSLQRFRFSFGHRNRHSITGTAKLSRFSARLLLRAPASHAHRGAECRAKLLRIHQWALLASRRPRRQPEDVLRAGQRSNRQYAGRVLAQPSLHGERGAELL